MKRIYKQKQKKKTQNQKMEKKIWKYFPLCESCLFLYKENVYFVIGT